MQDIDAERRRGIRIGMGLMGVVVFMAGLSLASVPLYRLYCKMTGFGGTPMIAAGHLAAAPRAAGTIEVRFNSDVAPNLPWSFKPARRSVTVRLGDEALAFYRAHNRADRPFTGNATYNVTPMKAAPYVNKVECFCFTEQTLAAGQEVEMPVSFYIDPAIHSDPRTRDVDTITLSYMFFPAKGTTAPTKGIAP